MSADKKIEAIIEEFLDAPDTCEAAARLVAVAREERDEAQERVRELMLQRDGAEARMARIEKERDALRGGHAS